MRRIMIVALSAALLTTTTAWVIRGAAAGSLGNWIAILAIRDSVNRR